MRKIILEVAVSLDGFIEGPNGEYDWCFSDQDYGLTAFSKRVDAIFMGRKTFDMAKKYEGPNPWEKMTTYVFSNSIKKLDEKNSVLVSGDIRKQVEDIRQKPGKDIWLFGGAELTTFFVNEALVDELNLAVHPILLGAGKPLFINIDGRKKLKLVEHKVYDTGLVSLTYKPS